MDRRRRTLALGAALAWSVQPPDDAGVGYVSASLIVRSGDVEVARADLALRPFLRQGP